MVTFEETTKANRPKGQHEKYNRQSQRRGAGAYTPRAGEEEPAGPA